jgi:FkbM family methyltransferase
LKRLWSILSFIWNHPLASGNRSLAYKNFFIWQIKQFVSPGARILPFVGESVLLVKKGMTGATGNIYCGLIEFEDMAFVLHYLRKGDLMGDIGANIGAYTILAAKNTGATVISMEPVPATFTNLQKNVELNNLTGVVTTMNCGAGSAKTTMEFTNEMDTVNHVATHDDKNSNQEIIQVPITTLDEIFVIDKPALLKIDVEGFEQEVVKGAMNLLQSESLEAIIIELNGSGMRYGFSEKNIHDELMANGFAPYKYDPFLRAITPLQNPGNLNTLYLKNVDHVRERISTAKKYSILQQKI